MENTLSTFKTTKLWILMVEEIRKETSLSCGIGTMEPTRNGRFFILMRKTKNQRQDLMKIVDFIETDHSI
jgi:hypothetical protein